MKHPLASKWTVTHNTQLQGRSEVLAGLYGLIRWHDPARQPDMLPEPTFATTIRGYPMLFEVLRVESVLPQESSQHATLAAVRLLILALLLSCPEIFRLPSHQN